MVLQKDANIKLLNTIKEKETILKQTGLSEFIVNEFTEDFSRLTAEDFVKHILVNQLNAKHIIIGYDHRFGRNRSANIEDLKRFGNTYNFTVEEISAQDINDVAVSSTKIRQALLNGNIKTANTYLNYNYFFTGTVVKGKGLGNTLNFPTANISVVENYKLIPKNGVYIVKSLIDNTVVYGMMNIGINPTVNGKTKSIEVHFFNFNNDLYSKEITIEILDRIRDEQKFNSLEDLQQQLKIDKKQSLDYFLNVK